MMLAPGFPSGWSYSFADNLEDKGHRYKRQIQFGVVFTIIYSYRLNEGQMAAP